MLWIILYRYINISNILDDESDTATEGEEEVKAREIRKQEVCLRIPNISTATTDTGSDTEVIFVTPKLIKNNISLISINHDDDNKSKLNKVNDNKSTFDIEESLNVLDTNSQINIISNDIINPDKSTNSHYSNLTSTTPLIEKCNIALNDIVMMNENESNIINNTLSTSLNNYNCHNESDLTKKCSQEIESDIYQKLKFLKTESINELSTFANTNFRNNLEEKKIYFSDNKHCNVINKLENFESSLDCIKNNFNSIINDNLVEDNGNIQTNNFTNDSKLSEKVIESKNYSKPMKLNIVTTEPYPKYTPTVEKAIKKYENKQPKKECIVM